MPNAQVDIIINGIDNATDELKDIRDGFKGIQKGIDDLNKTQKESADITKKQTLSWTDFRSAYQTLLDVVRVGRQVWAATVGELITYGDQVQKLKTITGQSSEETSRQIQLADDLRVSYESLAVALRFASNKGIDTSIAGLAKLSDEYKKLQPGIDRTQFLVEKFGRSGIEMAKILEKGSAAIREMAAATESGLIISSQDQKNIDQYNRSVDQLSDSFTSLKMNMGRELIPVFQELTDGYNTHVRALEIMEEQGLSTYHAMSQVGYPAALAQAKAELEAARATNEMGDASEAAAQSVAEMEAAQTAADEAAKALSSSLQGLIGLTMSLQTENDNYTKKLGDLQQEYIGLVTKQGEFMKGSEQWNEYQAKIDETKQKFFDLAAAHEEASRRIAFGLLQQKLAADGFTQAEFDGLMKIGVQWGILDQQTVDAASSMDAEMSKLSDSLSGVDYYGSGAKKTIDQFGTSTQKADQQAAPLVSHLSVMTDQLLSAKLLQGTFNYHFNITTSGEIPNFNAAGNQTGKGKGGGKVDAQFATGTDGWKTVPAGNSNDSYTVGLTSGEKFAVIPNNTRMTPTGGAGAGMINVNVNLSSFISLADQRDAEYKLKPIIERAVRSAQGVI